MGQENQLHVLLMGDFALRFRDIFSAIIKIATRLSSWGFISFVC